MSDTEATSARQALGRALELRRVHLGMKRKDLAQKAGLSYPYISELENGGKDPSAKALRQIADALDLSVAELIALGEHLQNSNDSEVEASAHALFRTSSAEVLRGTAAGQTTRPESRESLKNLGGRPTSEADAEHPWKPPATDSELSRLVRTAVRDEVRLMIERELPNLIREEIRRAIIEIERSARST